MAYNKQTFFDNQVLQAEHLNHMEDGIEMVDAKANVKMVYPSNFESWVKSLQSIGFCIAREDFTYSFTYSDTEFSGSMKQGDIYSFSPSTLKLNFYFNTKGDGGDVSSVDARGFIAVTDMAGVETYIEDNEYPYYDIYVLWGGEDGTSYSYTIDLVSPTITLHNGDIWRFTQRNYQINGAELITNIKGDTGKSAYDIAKEEGGYLGTEEEFAEKLATDFIDWFGVGVSIPEGADLNTYKTNGKYYATSEKLAQSLLNRPDKMNTNFVMWVFSRTNSTIKSQLMLTLTGKMYIRSSSSSAWRSWVAYTTSDEIEAIREELMAELITKEQIIPEFANDLSECEDTNKLYVLPDGYIYGYIKTTETVKKYTDLANNFEIGRLNSSGQVNTDAPNAVVCTDYIGFTVGDVIRIKGFGDLGDYNTTWCNKDKTCVNASKLTTGTGYADYSYDADTDIVTLTIKAQTNNYYIRFSGIPSTTTDDIAISVNEEIVEETVTHYTWASTGHAFIPCDYEDRIIDLEEDVSKLKNGVDGGEITVPSFWENAVNECITKIKALQVGRNCVTFPFFSDNHQRNGYAGLLIAKVMRECHIPYAFYGGDSISNGYIESEAEMIAQDKAFDDAMAYIPNGRFCRAVGNHDGFWNVSESTGDEYHYTREQVYELFMREESVAQNKHYGGDGTYYYVDDIASKVRWIVLNTNGDGNESIDNTQLAWLQDTALNFNESGWGVVIISHHPITNHYHANVTNAAEVINAIATYIDNDDANKADIIGWYSGHIHRDRIYSGVSANNTDDTEGAAMPFKQITITSDHTGIAYDDDIKHSVTNDDMSHAIDFVTINKDNRMVNITRLGNGKPGEKDRSYTY